MQLYIFKVSSMMTVEPEPEVEVEQKLELELEEENRKIFLQLQKEAIRSTIN